jgi:hypothetical protein
VSDFLSGLSLLSVVVIYAAPPPGLDPESLRRNEVDRKRKTVGWKLF